MMTITNWKYKNSQESIIEAILEDTNGNEFKGLLELSEVEDQE